MLFPGFESRLIPVSGTTIHVRVAGSGPPLVLVHGFPQTGATWHRVAPALSEQFTVVVPDLRGYGKSGFPPDGENHAGHSKRAMAQDIVEVMAALGFERFNVAGHDRGGRVTYRLALDHPDRVLKFSTLDIQTTLDTWEAMDWRAALGSYHWSFLNVPAPVPERLIGSDPKFYLSSLLPRWAGGGYTFDPEAMAEYEESFARPEAIHACCEDYRAGASIDVDLDRADREAGKRIAAPMLVLWGNRGRQVDEERYLSVWRKWATDVRGRSVACGHFIPEESPQDVIDEFRKFFGS
jgi:haloacetate dehalogenase